MKSIFIVLLIFMQAEQIAARDMVIHRFVGKNDTIAVSSIERITFSASKRVLPERIAGLFLPADASADPAYVVAQAVKAHDYGLNTVNLILDWRHLEPTSSKYAFGNLGTMIKAIHNAGCACILRIYANGGSLIEPWPIWLPGAGVGMYQVGNNRQPLPWDLVYQSRLGSLLDTLSRFIRARPDVLPEAIQASLGGEYGEQVLFVGDSWQNNGFSKFDDYFERLMTAEKQHADLYQRFFAPLKVALIGMVNSLHSDTIKTRTISTYIEALGWKWIQSNAGAGHMLLCSYGPYNGRLLQNSARTMNLLLEYQNGSLSYNANTECQAIPVQSFPLRLARMKEIETTYGFDFKGVTIDPLDLKEENRAGIAVLIAYLQ